MYVVVTIQATFRETRYDHGIDIKVEETYLTVEFLSNAKAVVRTENNDSKLLGYRSVVRRSRLPLGFVKIPR